MSSDLNPRWKSQRLKVADSPYNYILTLPSKGIGAAFIDSLNVWLDIPEDKTQVIKDVIGMLHNSSLMFVYRSTVAGDPTDISESMTSKMAPPSAGQAIYTYCFRPSPSNQHSNIYHRQGDRENTGDSHDALADITGTITTIFQETGALFRLSLELLALNSEAPISDSTLESLSSVVSLLGQYFQIRDDYMNLIDNKKGFCDDLDEGKYSLTLIHALQTDPSDLLINVLSMRRVQGKLTIKQKMLVLEVMKTNGSLDWTSKLLGMLHIRVVAEVDSLEVSMKRDNPALRALVERLKPET
ncbi:unnamed protein product [Fusarium graminearum]|nr:unnamed protein product [Fusarium graminearum]